MNDLFYQYASLQYSNVQEKTPYVTMRNVLPGGSFIQTAFTSDCCYISNLYVMLSLKLTRIYIREN